MIDLNGTAHRLCLLDTNFLTRLMDQSESRAKRIVDRVGNLPTVFAISIFTLIEVRDRRAAFDRLLRWFSWFPVVLMKSTHQLHAEEVAAYPDPSRVDPVLLAPVGIKPDPGSTHQDAVRLVFENPTVRRLMRELADGRNEIVDALLALRPTFPRPAGGYTPADARDFAEKICFQHAVMHAREWVESMGGASFDLQANAFPSVKAAAYSTFFRFYPDSQRRPRRSDAFDIGTAAVLPYVELAALEKNQADIVRNRIPKVDGFLDDLQVLTFADLS